MTRDEVELAPDGRTLHIRFRYRPELVDMVKSLDGRRWDNAKKTWSVPAQHVEQVYRLLAPHRFEFSSDVLSLMAGTLTAAGQTAKEKPRAQTGALPLGELSPAAPPPRTASQEPPAAGAQAAITVSELNRQIQACLRGGFPEHVWVVGEVIDFDKGNRAGHRYFSLIEKAANQHKASARIDAVLWENTAARLLTRLAQQAPDFAMRDGIEIRALVKIDFYVPSGRMSVHVEDIDPNHTLGKMALNREQVLRDLREKGLADKNRSLPLPIPPLRVGVLTSDAADGWNDFRKHLEQSGAGFHVTLLPVAVQGDKVRATVLAGLRWFAARADEFDCVCIVRGGGSRTDLAWFDDAEIAMAVAQHPLKILIGIGHERDRSVLDEIAHSEKTPTAVAEMLARTVLDERRANASRAIALQQLVADILNTANKRLDKAASALRQGVVIRLQSERSRLEEAGRRLKLGTRRKIGDARRDVAEFASKLRSAAQHACSERRHALLRASDRLVAGANRRIERDRGRLDTLAARRRLLDPRAVLRRGFALVRDADGRVIPAAAKIAAGQELSVHLRDGQIRTRAESVEIQP